MSTSFIMPQKFCNSNILHQYKTLTTDDAEGVGSGDIIL